MALIEFSFTKADVGAMRSIGQSGLLPAVRRVLPERQLRTLTSAARPERGKPF